MDLFSWRGCGHAAYYAAVRTRDTPLRQVLYRRARLSSPFAWPRPRLAVSIGAEWKNYICISLSILSNAQWLGCRKSSEIRTKSYRRSDKVHGSNRQAATGHFWWRTGFSHPIRPVHLLARHDGRQVSRLL